jgi:DNA processing protein
VAVVAGGVDVIYPQRNRGLYQQIAEHGALLSEWPLGSRPETWRFPARNRVVAALSAATVVVESARKGGSMYTVDEALRRNRAVFAVPGPIYSPASQGTNKLIADGAHSLHDLDELLDAVAPLQGPKPVQAELGIDSWLLEVVGWQSVELDTVVSVSGRSPSEVTLEVERLIGVGALRRFGGVIERAA